jgi:hypothetical protein
VNYSEFVADKSRHAPSVGFDVSRERLNPAMFEFQKDVTQWALRRGRAAEFEACGLGKTIQQLEWARLVAEYSKAPVLILAPLAVSSQTVREGEKFGIPVSYAQGAAQMRSAVTVTNYERLDAFDPGAFGGIVIDEGSILKNFTGAFRNQIIDAFKMTPYRLSCTATPAPNDFMELGNQAEFLGVMTRAEMLAMYFVHDGGSTQDWRLKGHAEDAFWRWVCSWAVLIEKPSDLGYDDGAFRLPPLEIVEHVIPVDHRDAHAGGSLFAMEAQTLSEQRAVKRGTISARVAKAAEIANGTDGPVFVWCELNDEGDALERAIRGAVQVAGADDDDVKAKRLMDFADGKIKCLVSKPKIAGLGMNFQRCATSIDVGVSHSFESFYQRVRRFWRFGQERPVTHHVIIAETEGRVAANLRRKEEDAAKMAAAMVLHMRDIQSAEIKGTGRTFTEYKATERMRIPSWLKEYAREP